MSHSPVNLETVLGYEFAPLHTCHSQRDVSLYALGIGTASDPLDQQDLRFVYELHQDGFQVLPSFGVTLPFDFLLKLGEVPGLEFNPLQALHGEQYLESYQPLPAEGRLTHRAKISQVYDKGKGALLILDVNSYDEAETRLCFNQYSIFLRGAGGFGGERGPAGEINLPPEREPDHSVTQKTAPTQALLYRLSGDRNPLHADPVFAMFGGFERPILHGLCTFGFALRAVLKTCTQNDPARFKSIKARFAKHVFPGETLITQIWQESDTRLILQTRVAERDTVVLSNAAVELYP